MPSEEDLMELGRDCAQLLINSLWQVWFYYNGRYRVLQWKVNYLMFIIYGSITNYNGRYCVLQWKVKYLTFIIYGSISMVGIECYSEKSNI